MQIHRAAAAAIVLLLGGAGAGAAEPDIVFLAPLSSAMPLARFDDGQLSEGILKDVGEAIAAKLGRRALFLGVPGKRVEFMLRAGQADGVCNVLPSWISGDFAWTRPLIPNAGIVISRTDAPVVRSLNDLAGQRVGTVLGYRYPALGTAIGTLFVREDARTVQQVFLKMEAGRHAHAIGERLELDYELRGNPGLKLREDLVYENYKTACAFSRASKIPFGAVEAAVDALAAAGAIDAILAHYR
jgi:polar amino acid transport system substrate-binding protein